MTLLVCIIAGIYAVFTLGLVFFWNRIPGRWMGERHVGQSEPPPYISVLIPVRNERDNLPELLSDLEKQALPKDQFEVLVIDDSSTDGTADIVTAFGQSCQMNLRLVPLPDEPTTSPKKRALETAMPQTRGELIITTDGDCRVGPSWLSAYNACYVHTGAHLISGPVTFTREQSVTDHLQTVEFSSLIGSGASAIEAGYPSLCNGANLAYRKQSFYDVNGYDGVRHIASGDDEFLMHKIAARYPGGILFLKNADAIVRTRAHQDWALFFRQRKRWASKWKHYQSATPLILALFVFCCNFMLIALSVGWAMGFVSAELLMTGWAIKCIPEWIFIGSILLFLDKRRSLPWILLTQLIYPFYVCLFGLAAQKPDYMWKGRKLQ